MKSWDYVNSSQIETCHEVKLTLTPPESLPGLNLTWEQM